MSNIEWDKYSYSIVKNANDLKTRFFNDLTPYFYLNESIDIFVDTNLYSALRNFIKDSNRKPETIEKYLGVISILNFLKNNKINFNINIPLSLMDEYWGLNLIENEESFYFELKEVKKIFETKGFSVKLDDRLKNYKKYVSSFEKIKNDREKILILQRMIVNLRPKIFLFSEYEKFLAVYNLESISRNVMENILDKDNIKFEYLEKDSVICIFSKRIALNIMNLSSNVRYFKSKNPSSFLNLARVVKIENSTKLLGFADIEMLHKVKLNIEFNDIKNQKIYCLLTMEKKLYDSQSKRSSVSNSINISSQSFKSNFKKFINDRNKLNKISEKVERLRNTLLVENHTNLNLSRKLVSSEK